MMASPYVAVARGFVDIEGGIIQLAANRDGIVRGWFDGKLVVERTDVVLRSTDFPDMKFNQFLMAPYFGPGLLPHAQKLWIDELAVGTQRIGPLPAKQDQGEEEERGP